MLDEFEPEPEELSGRLPCRDGNCLGVAGLDGRCTECGAFIGYPAAEVERDEELRLPCPDGSCIGVIGPDGLCTECGQLAGDGGRGADQGWDDDGWDDDGPDDDGPDDEEDEDDDERLPCPDGACIGIVGPDGRCTECGRSADDQDEG